MQVKTSTWRYTGAVAWLLLGLGAAHAQGLTPPPTPAEEQPSALASGPVNEAFAAPVPLDTQSGLTAPSRPPDPIPEAPSADRPVGDEFRWMPGYWSWDTKRESWVWVSGCWRAAPPGMAWLPGYWTQSGASWRWVPGLWTSADTSELSYLPPPPEPLDIAAPGPPPEPDCAWVPGCWFWREGRYAARHGYWVHQQHGWLWTPAHVAWTPYGHLFVPGYWDLSVERRGLLFAPCSVPYGWAGGAFEPTIELDLSLLTANLFVCPSYCHYYVGDFYDPWYEHHGIYPRCRPEAFPVCYDPFFVHDRWHHHDNADGWLRGERDVFEQRRANVQLRPATTYHDQQVRLARGGDSFAGRAPVLAQPIRAAVESSRVLHFEHVTRDTQQEVVRQAKVAETLRDDRRRWETAPQPAASSRPVTRAPSGVVVVHAPLPTTSTPSKPAQPAPPPPSTPRAGGREAPDTPAPRPTAPPAARDRGASDDRDKKHDHG